MTKDCGVKVQIHVDETLEAVALVLRDLKADFEKKLAKVSAKGTAERDGLLSRLTDLAEKIDVVAETDRRTLNTGLEELHQQLVASADNRREENEKRAAELEAVLEVLRKKIDETEKFGRGAVDIARATQESMLRLTEDAKEAMEPLAEGVDDARARHQAVVAELAELDAKAVLRPELEELLRTYVLGNLPEGFRAPTLSELHEKMTALEASSTAVKDFREIHQETQDTFQRIDAECKSLADADEKYQKKFSEALEAAARKSDLEAVQQLLEETAGRVTDVLDFSQSAADSTDQAFEKHQARTETAIEALRNTFSDRQEQLRDQMAGMRAEIFDDLEGSLRALMAARVTDSDKMVVAQAERFITKLSENIKGERGPAGHVSRVQVWVPDYEFKELALVRHRSGLWQAVRDTTEEPGSGGSAWEPVATGIENVCVAPDEVEPGSYSLLAQDSCGRRHETRFRVPLPVFHKTWNAEHEYRHYDSVMEDGHRWLAVKDAPTGPPSRSEDWILLGMRGGRGARGAKGDSGPAGPAPDMEEILDAYDRRRFEADGTPVSSFRGSWRFGADYVVGDFVRGDGVMALCREAHRAENPPTATGAQWEILFELPGPAAETGPTPHELQAQIAALTAQIAALTTGRDS